MRVDRCLNIEQVFGVRFLRTVMYVYIVYCVTVVVVVVQDIDKGHYAESDQYVAHAVVTKDRKNVFLATDK